MGGETEGANSTPTPGATDGEVAGESAEVPTAIDAGLTGWTTGDVWGSGLIGGGVALLLSAAVILALARGSETA